MRGSVAVAATAAWLLLPRAALACATCFGAADSPLTDGVNKGILTLVGVVGLVYVGIGKFLWDLRKRSRRLARQAGPVRLIHGGKP